VWLWAGGVDKDERPGLQKRMVLKRQVKESKKVVRVLWGVYLLYPFVPGIMISHYRIPIDQPVQCDVQFFFVALSSSDHGDDPMIAVFEESAT